MSLYFQLAVAIVCAVFSVDLFRNWRQRKVSLAFFAVFEVAAVAAVVFVFSPRTADSLFGWLGISSGVNGAFFFAICLLLLVAKQHYQSLTRIEQQQTEIVRQLAILSSTSKVIEKPEELD